MLLGNTTINTGAGAISLGAVTGAFTLALTTSVNATIESMIDAGATLDLSTVTGGTVTVSGALTTLALTTAVTGANIALSGGGSVQNAVTFNNTGNVSISNGFTFANGVLPPGGVYPILTSLAGAVSATAGSMDFGNTQITANCTLTSPVLTSIHTNLTLNAGTLTLGGALRVYGTLTIPAGTTLDDSGNYTITMDGNWSNTGGTFTSGTGTVVFTGTAAQSVNPGASSFRNLTKQGAFTLSLLTNDLAVTGTLTIAVGGGTVDVGNLNFTIATLTNNGIFRLQGTQATQAVTTMTMVAGTVQYYDGAVDGTIGLATFYSLQILGPARTFTLGQDITVGPAAGTGLLQISGGVLDVSGASHSITVRGNWSNAVGDAGFNSQSGSVIFTPPAGRDDLGLGPEHLVRLRMPGAERHDPVPGQHAAEDQELCRGDLPGQGHGRQQHPHHEHDRPAAGPLGFRPGTVGGPRHGVRHCRLLGCDSLLLHPRAAQCHDHRSRAGAMPGLAEYQLRDLQRHRGQQSQRQDRPPAR